MIAFTLLVIAAGYFVFAHASAQKGEVKTVGRIVGLIIMILALAGVACGICYKAKGMCGGGDMMMKSYCPMKGR